MGINIEDDEEELEEPDEQAYVTDAPGPDERDRDLMDGTWEAEYYSGRIKTRNWGAIGAGVAILVLAGMVVPMIVAAFN